ncbi:hypothetical protein HanXRQr2_Chr01g0008061 [Helianthus annuus]|uniref:Uncharacterized protein n=1 Tax=Helianthus annuus TaxID=4232 RepID=A0A9K3JT84_HELAN|nr:hypothetical protein HanXRQr2_Chr01g0008061 [Helianthus annuus]
MCCLGLKYSWFFGKRLKTDEPSSSTQVGSFGSVSSHSLFMLRGAAGASGAPLDLGESPRMVLPSKLLVAQSATGTLH